MDSFVTEGNRVLVVWAPGAPMDDVQNFVLEVKRRTGINGFASLENSNQLVKSHYDASSIDAILSGFDYPFIHDDQLLSESLRILKPGGLIVIHEPVLYQRASGRIKTPIQLASTLRLNGFLLKSPESRILSLNSDHRKFISETYGVDDFEVCEVIGEKPYFEVGSSVPLPFTETKALVWKLDDAVEEDLVNEDDLLGDSDIQKPQLSSLKVCNTTGKRKACKDCSCGLAEELAGETVAKDVGKSSCGNCYLGDAFRCASCPYLGMPAFKPGEKIVLPDNQLKADS